MDRDISNIRIFDKDLNFLGEIDNFTSLLFTKKWDTYGEFEFHVMNFDKELIKKGNIIMVNNDESKTGIIEYIEIDEESGQDIKVKGFTLLYLLTFRLVVPPEGDESQVFNSYPDEIMINLVKNNAVGEGRRGIENLKVEEPETLGKVLSFSASFTNLADEITNICKASGLGASINFDIKNKALVFKVLEGKDLSTNQNENPPAIFSVEYDNVKKQNYVESDMKYRNCAYITKKDNTSFEYDTSDGGMFRREIYIKDSAEEDNEKELKDLADLKLKDNESILSYECEVDGSHYKKDWNLGDIVTTISKKYGFIIHNRVSEVKESYEKNTIKIEPTFGSIIPTILDEVKKNKSTSSGKRKSSVGVTSNDPVVRKGYSLDFKWDGTKLGVKREDETSSAYVYKDLIGKQGIQGPKGDIGLTGPRGEKGDKGDIGPMGVTAWGKLTEKPDLFTGSKSIIGNVTDFNNIKDIGCYKVQAAPWKDASTYHSPNGFLSTVSPYGLLLVLGCDGQADSEKRRVQVYYPYSTSNNGTLPLSRCYNNGTWNSWHYESSPEMYPISILYGNGSTGTYGSMTIQGQKNNWAGLYFNSATRYLMISSQYQGSFTSDNKWQWRFNNGVLDVGTVPWNQVTGVPVASESSNGLMTSNMVSKVNKMQKVVVQSSEPSEKMVNDVWIQII